MSSLETNVGSILAIVAIVAAWLIYRAQRSSARRGVLDAVDAELRLHAAWLLAEYDAGVWPADAWWSRSNLIDAFEAGSQPVMTVNRLSTVAIDNAIAQGPALFINPRLVFALVQYRQRIEQLNQLIDNATVLQQASEIWRKPVDYDLVEHFAMAVAWIHWIGIGTMTPRGNRDGSHTYFIMSRVELEREMGAGRFARWAWFTVGRTWPRENRQPLVAVR